MKTQVLAAIGEVGAAFGKIDILVNNAGIDDINLIEDLTIGPGGEKMLRIHMTGHVPVLGRRCCRACGRGNGAGSSTCRPSLRIRARRGGRPIARPRQGIMGFTKALAREVALEGITVNTLNPGPIDTPMIAGAAERT